MIIDKEDRNMTEQILVTIYCLAYNHEKYIRSALEGFVSQETNFKYEVLIHDDASVDNTAEIIREYEQKYPNIIKPIYQRENQHSKHVNAFEIFIRPRIHGKYLAVCEGDDCWTDSHKLQMQVDFLEKNEDYVACVHQTRKFFVPTGKSQLFSIYNENKDMDMRTVVLHWGEAFHISSLVLRKEYYYDLPDFCTASGAPSDWSEAIYLLLCGKVFYFNQEMSIYRVCSGPASWTQCLTTGTDAKEKTRNMWGNCINMLKMADKYSNFKYHRVFKKGINKYQRIAFEKPTFVGKCKIILKLNFPWLYKLYTSILNKERK